MAAKADAVPTGLVFVPGQGVYSHGPEEHLKPVGAAVLGTFPARVQNLAGRWSMTPRRLRFPMGMFAGIDWGGASHQLAVVDDEGRSVSNRKFNHDVAGIADLVEVLGGHRSSLEGVAIKRTEGLLVDTIQQVGLTVYAVGPRVSARARELRRLVRKMLRNVYPSQPAITCFATTLR